MKPTALPFGRLWYDGPGAVSNAIGYASQYSRSHDTVIRVYDEAGNVIETHEHAVDFRNLLLFDNPACLDEQRATQIGRVLLRKG